LTSQIFANIYLHEFDRFVRHECKPIAYLRYGDDFILFAPNQKACIDYRRISQQFLEGKFGLPLNPRNDVIIRSRDGLHFLGHRIFANGFVVEPATEQRLIERFSSVNAASYQALALPKRLRKQLPWLLQQNLEEILDE
jgi:RNA-directed DNA polymerase